MLRRLANKNFIDHPVNEIIKTQLTQKKCEVFLYWGPAGSGKTTSIHKVLNCLHNKECIFIQPDKEKSMCKLFNEQLKIPQKPQYYSNLFPVRDTNDSHYPVIVFDHFYHFIEKADMQPFLNELVDDCKLSQNFSALLVLNNPGHVNQVLHWNANIKFIGRSIGCGRWTSTQVLQYVDNHIKTSKLVITDKKRRDMIELGVLSGSVGFLETINLPNLCPFRRAIYRNILWVNGIKEIESVIGKPGSQTLKKYIKQ